MKNALNLLFILSTVLLNSTGAVLGVPRHFTGTIQFPTQIDRVPSIRVYHAGRKILTSVSENSHRVTFSLPEQKTIYYLVITPKIEFVSEENIVKYLTLSPGAKVKVYVLELVAPEQGNASRYSIATAMENTALKPWHIREVVPPTENARIPDDALIVCLDPSWLSVIEGGSPVDFPKIVIKNDIVAQLGSEERVQEVAAQWLLAALNTDAIHGNLEQEIQAKPQSKTLVAFSW
jgi:hypothetical protein